LTNFHDFCGSDEYANTAVGLLATAGGGSYGGTLEHLRPTFRTVHAWTIPHEVGIRGASRVVETGDDVPGPRITDEDLRRRTERLGRVVVKQADRLRK